jgi:hypothetical protein
MLRALSRGDADAASRAETLRRPSAVHWRHTKDRPDWAAEFLEEVKVTYPEVVDFDGQLLASVRSAGLPVTLVLDSQGQVAGRQIGRITEKRLTELIDQATVEICRKAAAVSISLRS